MSIDLWLAFAAASAIVLVIPGPTILLVVSYSLGHGRRAAVPLVGGVALGDFTAITASLLGLGALLAASGTLFAILKWVGAAYLVFLGIKLWRAAAAPMEVAGGDGQLATAESVQMNPRRLFWHSFAVTATNPKGLVFFVAFLPQFLDPTQPVLAQFAVMELTFLVLASVNCALYAAAASGARSAIRRPSVLWAVNRVGGSILIAAGIATAAWRRAEA